MGRLNKQRRSGLVAALLCLAALVPLFSQPAATISFRIIVVESQAAAERLLEQMRNGENLVALALAVSVDPSASNGGLVGPVPMADLRPEIRTALATLRMGELSGVVRLPTGFGILKIVPNTEVLTGSGAGSTTGGPTVMGSVPTPLSATGSVRYVYDVSGYAETVLALRNVKMTLEDSQDLAKLCEA